MGDEGRSSSNHNFGRRGPLAGWRGASHDQPVVVASNVTNMNVFRKSRPGLRRIDVSACWWRSR